MKLPEFKGILKSVSAEQKLSQKEGVVGTKQVVLIEIPSRTIDDGWGGSKKLNAEHYELDVINKKVDPALLQSLIDKKVLVTQSYLNGYEYLEKETQTVKYGKNITLISIKEFK
jgi:hypothetical protein